MNALQSILSGKDTFVCLPTGQGKSILFECFPHTAMTLYTVANLSKASRRHAVLVISPLISLMNSQVHDLRKRNQSALRLLYTVNNTHARLGAVRRAIGPHKVIIGGETLITQRCKLIAIPARPPRRMKLSPLWKNTADRRTCGELVPITRVSQSLSSSHLDMISDCLLVAPIP